MIINNLKLAVRRLFKAPFVTTVAVLSPHELVNLSVPGPKPGSNSCGNAGTCQEVFSYPMFRDIQKSNGVFTDVAAHVQFGANLSYRNQTLSGEALLVSGSYFPVLGITPAIGRLL